MDKFDNLWYPEKLARFSLQVEGIPEISVVVYIFTMFSRISVRKYVGWIPLRLSEKKKP